MQPTTVVEGFRLSPQQRRLWKLQEDGADARDFTAQLVLLLEGEAKADELRDAVEKVCERHEALRTVFQRLPGVVMPVQAVAERVRPSYRVVELSEGRETVGELLDVERRRNFDYERGPLVHATLFELSPERHMLSITMPGLCADSRTLNNFAEELRRTYSQTIGEEEPLQYIQFSEWQNSLAEEEDAAKGKAYWARQDLSHASAALPGQRASQRVRDELPRELQLVKLTLSRDDTNRITALATKHDTTNAVVLLTAWQTLLWRMTQQPVVMGNVSEGRSYELLHDAFGLFARVLPVCCQFTEDLRFSEVVAEIDRFQRESEEWQDYFSIDEAAPGSLRYFAFGFEYTRVPGAWQADSLRMSVYRQHCYFEPFDLKLLCLERDSETEVTFEYNNAAFDEDYVRHLAGRFQTLLDAALANAETPVAELEIVSEAERQQVVVEWNKTGRDYQLEDCVHELFDQQVERTPDRLAAVFQNEQLTFAELNRRANQLARYLHAKGVGPETPVGMCVEPSLEMLVAVLGILKAGGAYVPLDPRHPQQRIDQLLQDAGAAILLTREELTRLHAEDTDGQTAISSENLAYIIYTSGSNGQPKGVMVQHRSVVDLAAALQEEVYAETDQPLKVALSSPLAFDASVKQLVQLLYGHTLYIFPEELRLDAKAALAYLDQHQIDVLDTTPSQLKLLLAAGLDKDGPKVVLVGGEAVDESTWSQLAEIRQTRFFNVYGPTECTVDATWAPITNTQEQPASDATIGRPIPNAQTYILDKNLKPSGIHLNGELYISGTGLARGYLNSPERTAERFIPDGLSGQTGARLYRTGDIARYSPDGSIIFAGRNDAQVKIRGHRIELGEIESVLLNHENVRQAVVVACEAANNDLRLVGYVVATDGTNINASELRQSLSEQLPDYMVPSFIVALDELPLTRNGKIDSKALPPPETARKSREENYVAPRNEIEETITGVWQEVLGLERIGVNDNFFDAGGHSLLMVQVHTKLSELFDKNISIVEMFAKPTISALAEYFSETNGHKPTFEQVMDRAARRRQAVSTRH